MQMSLQFVSSSASKHSERFEKYARTFEAEYRMKSGSTSATNTPKRLYQARKRAHEAAVAKLASQCARGIASAIREGRLPPAITELPKKEKLAAICRDKIKCEGYYDYFPTGEFWDGSDAAVAIRELGRAFDRVKDPDDELRKRIALDIEELKLARIPGFFPTPDAVIDAMFEHVTPQPNDTALEPSAGAGHLIDGLYRKGVKRIYAIERHAQLFSILRQREKLWNRPGVAPVVDLTHGDFELHSATPHVDIIMMNPPFENGTATKHVMRACQFLKPGGVLISVMPMTASNTSGSYGLALNNFINKYDGFAEWHDLPAGSFKESGTNVSACLLVVCRDEFSTELKPVDR